MAPRGGREFEDAVCRKRPHGQVVVAGPAEAAQVGAAADDLDQESGSELGVGRKNAGRRRIGGVGSLEGSLANRQRRLDTRFDRVAGDRTGRRAGADVTDDVVRLVERGDVEAALERKASQQVRPIGGRRERAAQPRDQHFAFAGRNHVGERRQRLWVHERHGAADNDERVVRSAPFRAGRNAGEPQQRQHVHVVPLEGHRERDDVEIADRRL